MRIGRNTVVSFHYTLTDGHGQLLDTSRGREPVRYLHGHGQVFPGLERQLHGLTAGAVTNLVVPAAEGYGVRRPELTFRVRREQFPPGAELTVGSRVMREGGAAPQIFTVVGLADDTVVLDGNHPLAGKDLHFEVEVVHVRAATPEEVEHGQVDDGPHRH